VSDRVPPSTRSISIVGKVVDNPLINTFHRESLLRRVFDCHEDETAKRVRGFGRGGRQLLGRNGHESLRQRRDSGQGLQGQQVPSLMQPAEAGQVILVRYCGGTGAV